MKLSSQRALLPLCGLIAAVPLSLTGCVYDQGPRIEMADFLKIIEEEKAIHALGETVPPDPDLIEKRLPEDYLLGPGDTVEIRITGLLAPKGESIILRRISEQGTITLPVIDAEPKDAMGNPLKDKDGNAIKANNVLVVEGRKAEEVEKLITAKYAPDYIVDPQIQVNVAGFKFTPVVMTGQVGQPGVIQLKRDELNVLMAVARAGWIRETSSGEVTVKPAKGGQETFQFWMATDISRALNRTVERGDIIDVSRRPSDSVYLTGLFRNGGGPQQIQPGQVLTLRQAIAGAGGLDPMLDPREATLIRMSSTGEPIRVRLDFDRLMNNSDPDIALQAGDIIDVYQTEKTRAYELFNRFMRLGAGAGLDFTYNPFFMGGLLN